MEFKIFKIKKKRKRKILYEGFKEKIIQKEQEELRKKEPLKLNNNVINTKAKHKNLTTNLNMTLTIGVASLDEKCGCTYITQSIAKYIKKEINSSVCIIDLPGKNLNTQDDILIYNSVDICNKYDDFKYIVIDVGNLNKCTEEERNEFKRSNIKIMVSKLEDNYLKQIAACIREDKKAVKKWIFLFNYVAPDLKKAVGELMEDYEYYCLNLFNKDNLDDKTRKIFKAIVKR